MTAHSLNAFDFFNAGDDDTFYFGNDITKSLTEWIAEVANRTPATHHTFESIFGHGDKFVFNVHEVAHATSALTSVPGATAVAAVAGQGHAPKPTTVIVDAEMHGHRPGDHVPGTSVGVLGTTPNDGPPPVTPTAPVGVLGTTPNDGPPHVALNPVEHNPKAPLGQPICPVNPDNHGHTPVVTTGSADVGWTGGGVVRTQYLDADGRVVTVVHTIDAGVTHDEADVGGMRADPNSPLVGHHYSADVDFHGAPDLSHLVPHGDFFVA